MTPAQNFVAVDWRAGKDRIYFFYKESNTYSRFDIGDNAVPDGYPTPINFDNWHNFHEDAKSLRFGFTTTDFDTDGLGFDKDILWLFYYDDQIPMVCKYDQDTDKVIDHNFVSRSVWSDLHPYFDRIVAGTLWHSYAAVKFRFLMNDGNSLLLKWNGHQRPPAFNDGMYEFELQTINERTWPGLAPYKHRIITAAQNDRTFADSYFYIFLTDNEYITYNIEENKVQYGPRKVDNDTWPGLITHTGN